jgi:hypothetical protein
MELLSGSRLREMGQGKARKEQEKIACATVLDLFIKQQLWYIDG